MGRHPRRPVAARDAQNFVQVGRIKVLVVLGELPCAVRSCDGPERDVCFGVHQEKDVPAIQTAH